MKKIGWAHTLEKGIKIMSKQKNIVLLFTDQQRFDTLGAAGNPLMITPHLDRLAQDGTLFESAYTPCPVCVPARCSMHYGLYPLATDCLENKDSMPEDGRPSVADVLTRTGYRTHAIGKRHFTPDTHAHRGFQTLERQEEIICDVEQDEYHKYLRDNGCGYAIEPFGVRSEAYYVPQLSPLPPAHHPTQWVGDRTVEWLQTEGSSDQPFFLFSSFIHPHPPFAPPTPWHKLYRAPDMPLPKNPENAEELYLYTNYIQNRYKGRDQGRDLRLHQLIKSYYYASISFVDFQVGRILDALERTGKLDDTLILFSSDHGEFLGDYNCFGKRSFLDSAARVPLLARLPGAFTPGTRCTRPASLIDVMPTALDVAGCPTGNLHGESLISLANGTSSRREVFGHYRWWTRDGGIFMIVSERWKYIWSAVDHKELLFDRLVDPLETRNRAQNILCQDVVTELRKRLQQHLRTMPGHPAYLNESGWIKEERFTPPTDPDAGLICQDPPCFLDNIRLPGYSRC
jgi:arylsulfatase A-like enzyme